MNTKTISIGLAVIIIAGVGFYLYSSNNSQAPAATDQSTNTATGMRVENNAIVALDQKPGNTVLVSQVYLAAPGYVVIHDASGKILGSSALLRAGENNNVAVQLSRTTKDGETLQAMLHNERNNNAMFDESTDTPVESKLGGPIMGTFTISSQASENTPVSM